jgi:hypothetical protein
MQINRWADDRFVRDLWPDSMRPISRVCGPRRSAFRFEFFEALMVARRTRLGADALRKGLIADC